MKNSYAILLMLGLTTGINAQFTVTVDTTVKFQVFQGFGVSGPIAGAWSSFTEQSLRQEWDNLGRVNLRVLTQSDGLNIYTPAGLDSAVDFTKTVYYDLAKYIIEAKKRGMHRFIFEIFSAPGWMKSGGKTLCYPCTYSENHLLPEHYLDYAKLLGLLVKGFISTCGDFDFYLSISNEPRFNEPWAKTVYIRSTYADVLKVVGDYFQTNDTLKKVKFFGPTDMPDWAIHKPWMDTLLDVKPDAGKYIAAWGCQYYMLGVDINTTNSLVWTNFTSRLLPKNIEIWQSTGGFSGLTFIEGLENAVQMQFALKEGQASSFQYLGLRGGTGFFDDVDKLGSRGQIGKMYYRFIRPGYRQFQTTESENDFALVGLKKNDAVTITCVNTNATQAKTFQLDKTIAPFFHIYSIDNNEQACVYKGKVRNNTFTVNPQGVLTLYYDDVDTNAIYAAVPPKITVKEITENSVTLTWTPSTKYTMKAVPTSYDVNMKPGYKLVKNYIFMNGVTVNDTTYKFTGLKSCSEYSLTVFSYDEMNNPAFSTVKVTIPGTNCAIHNSAETEPACSIYPNPASDMITIHDLAPNSMVTIYNSGGMPEMEKYVANGQGMIDVSGLAGGVYIVKISSSNGLQITKFIKQ